MTILLICIKRNKFQSCLLVTPKEHLVDIYIIIVELNQNSGGKLFRVKQHSCSVSYYLVFPQHMQRCVAY